MNYKKIVLIILTIIVYILGLVFIIIGMKPLAVVGMVVESVLLILLSAFQESNESIDTSAVDASIVLELEQENKESKQRILALEKELEETVASITGEKLADTAEWMTQETKYKEQIEKLTNDLNAALANAVIQGDISESFLPPVEADEKDHEIIDIISIAKETIDELNDFARSAGIVIHISTSDDKLLVSANRSRIRIMFRNIIDNSIKYMNKSGVLIVTISNIDDDIFIVLKDNGAGLSEDETKHIFELNFQGSNRISGNGLGLTQAKAIVDYYGGTIYAKSNIGRGMGIYIQLPTT